MLVKNKTTSKNSMDYIEAETYSRPDKSGIMVITEMPTRRIIAHVARRHKVALLALCNLAQVYLYWHAPIVHIYRIFF